MAIFYPMKWHRRVNRQRIGAQIAALTRRSENRAGRCCIGCQVARSIASTRLLFLRQRRVDNVWVCSNCGLTCLA